MNFVKALNAVSSQVWAVVLILMGVASFAIANFCHTPQVMTGLVSVAGGMIGGALMMFQHQTKTPTEQEPSPAIDPPQERQQVQQQASV